MDYERGRHAVITYPRCYDDPKPKNSRVTNLHRWIAADDRGGARIHNPERRAEDDGVPGPSRVKMECAGGTFA